MDNLHLLQIFLLIPATFNLTLIPSENSPAAPCLYLIFVLLFVTTYILVLMFRKKLVTTNEAKAHIMNMDEKECIKDRKLLIKSLVILILIIIGFMLHGVLHYKSATIAIAGARANVIATGIAEEHGHKITIWNYMKIAFPIMLLTIVACSIYLFVFYLMQ